MRALPLRLKVALSFSATTAVVLAGLGLMVYLGIQGALLDQARTGLTTQLAALEEVPSARLAQALGAMEGTTFAQAFDAEGRPLAASPQVAGVLLRAPDLPAAGEGDRELERQVRLSGQREPEEALLTAHRSGPVVLVVGTSREDVSDTLQTVLVKLLVASLLGLVLASALGYVVAGSALRPVERMRQRAALISAQRSDERLPVPVAEDEIHRLGATLNQMLDRLDEGLRRERRFVGEAGHELRTPLALLRMELDLALSRPRSRNELEESVRSASEEVDRLAGLAEDLLLLAATGRDPAEPEAVPVRLLLDRVAARFSTAVEAAGRTLTVTADPAYGVSGSPDQLERAVTNLVDNALRHGEGHIDVVADATDGWVSITVRDEGRGMPDLADGQALDPFTRSPAARPGPGAGLGLAIVDAIVTAHGGEVELVNGAATAVKIRLPRA